MKGFLTFIREQGVVGLAVGFILGGAVSNLVKSIVSDIIQPLIDALFVSTDGLKSLGLTVHGSTIAIGNFLVVLIDFIIIAAVVYFLVKGLKLDKLDKKKK